MKSPKDIKPAFDVATYRAVYNTPTAEHPYHMIYLLDDRDIPLNAIRFEDDLALFDPLKDRERVMVTIGPEKPDGSIDFDIQQLS